MSGDDHSAVRSNQTEPRQQTDSVSIKDDHSHTAQMQRVKADGVADSVEQLSSLSATVDSGTNPTAAEAKPEVDGTVEKMISTTEEALVSIDDKSGTSAKAVDPPKSSTNKRPYNDDDVVQAVVSESGHAEKKAKTEPVDLDNVPVDLNTTETGEKLKEVRVEDEPIADNKVPVEITKNAKGTESALDLGAKIKEGAKLEVVWQVTNDDDEDTEVLFSGTLTKRLSPDQGVNNWATFNLRYNAKDEFPASDRVVCFNEAAELYDMEDGVYMQWHHPGFAGNQTLSLQEIMEQQSALEQEDGGNEHEEANAAFAALPIQQQLIMAEKFRAFADNMKSGLNKKIKTMKEGAVVTKDDILDILDSVKASYPMYMHE